MISRKHQMALTTPSDREVTLTRSFDAPRELVFEVLTKPEHVRNWWGWRTSSLVVCEIDLRPGGAWRYVTRNEDGSEFGFLGEFREITPPSRIVYTEALDVDVLRDRPAIVTVTLVERDGVTTLTTTSLLQTAEDRDMMISSGMETGAAESYDRLEELLATL